MALSAHARKARLSTAPRHLFEKARRFRAFGAAPVPHGHDGRGFGIPRGFAFAAEGGRHADEQGKDKTDDTHDTTRRQRTTPIPEPIGRSLHSNSEEAKRGTSIPFTFTTYGWIRNARRRCQR